MNQFERLKAIAAYPQAPIAPVARCMTARQIIEARLGRKLPPVADMQPDERNAVKRLAIHLIRSRMKGETQ